MKKLLFTVFLFQLFLGISYSQEEDLKTIQINVLKQIRDAFILRKTFILNKNPYFFDDSYDKLKLCDSLNTTLLKNYSEKIDLDFFTITSKAINKELNTTKEDITKLSKGSKSETSTDDGKYWLTDGERTYFTFLLILEMKIDDKIKAFSK